MITENIDEAVLVEAIGTTEPEIICLVPELQMGSDWLICGTSPKNPNC